MRLIRKILRKLFYRHRSFDTYGHHPNSDDVWKHHRWWWVLVGKMRRKVEKKP